MKKYSGFTLVEVIVAMAILSIMTLMISICYSAVSTVNIQTQGLNEKMDLMSRYAEVGELGTASTGGINGSRVNTLSDLGATMVASSSSGKLYDVTKFTVQEYQVMSPVDNNGGAYALDDDASVAWASPTTSDTVKGNYMFFTVEKKP